MKFTLSILAAALMGATAASPAPTRTLTNTFAPVATGCGVPDREIIHEKHSRLEYQVFCGSQPGGYASIPSANFDANIVTDCVSYCNHYNHQESRPYTCHAALFTKGDNKCQLLWEANGNISPRSDSDYLVAHNF